MAVYGIVAEYNPFHNGHKFQIDSIKKKAGDAVVVIMSPNVVQRGDFAIFDKFTRAHAALCCGADLVLELPSVYALSTAQKFAFGAVSILDALGFVDFLCFGSESNNLKLIKKTAEISACDSVSCRIKELLKEKISYASARCRAVSEICPESAEILENPNDILCVEYISQLYSLNSKIIPLPILRKGSGHDSGTTDGRIASASYIRSNLCTKSLKKFCPVVAAEIFEKNFKDGNFSLGAFSLSQALLLKLRTADAEEISAVSDVSEGLENRIIRAAKSASDFDELCDLIKTKRYTMSRIRRILMCSLLDLPAISEIPPMPFVRALGASKKGTELLSEKSGEISVVSSLAKARCLGSDAETFAGIEEKCTEAFNLTLKNKSNGKNDFSQKFITV